MPFPFSHSPRRPARPPLPWKDAPQWVPARSREQPAAPSPGLRCGWEDLGRPVPWGFRREPALAREHRPAQGRSGAGGLPAAAGGICPESESGEPPPPPARRPRFHSLYFPVSGLHLHRREEEVALGQAEPAGSAAVPAPGGWHCGRRLPLRSRLPPTRAGRPQVKLALGFSVTHLTPLCPRPPTFLQGLLLPPTVLPL